MSSRSGTGSRTPTTLSPLVPPKMLLQQGVDPTRTCAAGAALRHRKHSHRGRCRAAPAGSCAAWHAAAAGSCSRAPQRCWGLPWPWQVLCIEEVQPAGVPILNDHEGLGEGGAGMTLVRGGARARGVATAAWEQDTAQHTSERMEHT